MQVQFGEDEGEAGPPLLHQERLARVLRQLGPLRGEGSGAAQSGVRISIHSWTACVHTSKLANKI